MRDKLFSTVRVAVAAAIGALFSWLVSQGIVDADLASSVDSLIDSISFLVGTVAWYFVGRVLERYAPWLLGPKTPVSISHTSPPRGRF